MTDRKYLPVSEFQSLGYLQEINRLFCHPHGLALEVTRITDEDGEHYALKLNAEQWRAFKDAIGLIGDRTSSDEWEEARTLLMTAQENAKRYDVGDAYLSGIWDSRDDPEGVIFGEWSGEDRAKAQAVADERARHAEARERLFHGEVPDWADQPTDADIEPTDWRYEFGAGTDA